MVKAPNLTQLEWMVHGFGIRTSEYPAGIITLRQIHSCIVQEAAHMPDGVSDEVVAEGDALVSRIPGVLVGIRTADCVPILIADPVTRAVAAIHAGWRGTAGGMVGAAIETLCANGTTKPGDLIAAIGPSIGACCYETGPEVALQFDPAFRSRTTVGGAAHINLRAANEAQLHTAGVSNIWISADCTFCAGAGYYSFRREPGQAGRMISFAGVAQAGIR